MHAVLRCYHIALELEYPIVRSVRLWFEHFQNRVFAIHWIPDSEASHLLDCAFHVASHSAIYFDRSVLKQCSLKASGQHLFCSVFCIANICNRSFSSLPAALYFILLPINVCIVTIHLLRSLWKVLLDQWHLLLCFTYIVQCYNLCTVLLHADV